MPKRGQKGMRIPSGSVVRELRTERKEDDARFPSPFIANITYPVVLRYKVTSSGTPTSSVTRKNLLDIFVSGATTTSYTRNWSAVKIRKIEIWGGSLSTTATTNQVPYTSVSLEWFSTYGPGIVKSAAGNFERPAHLVVRPPRGSLAGFWSLDGSNESEVIFKLSGSASTVASTPFQGLPLGSYLDIHVQAVAQDDEPVVVYTGVTAVVGQNYIRDFSTAPGTTPAVYQPEGYTTIA